MTPEQDRDTTTGTHTDDPGAEGHYGPPGDGGDWGGGGGGGGGAAPRGEFLLIRVPEVHLPVAEWARLLDEAGLGEAQVSLGYVRVYVPERLPTGEERDLAEAWAVVAPATRWGESGPQVHAAEQAVQRWRAATAPWYARVEALARAARAWVAADRKAWLASLPPRP